MNEQSFKAGKFTKIEYEIITEILQNKEEYFIKNENNKYILKHTIQGRKLVEKNLKEQLIIYLRNKYPLNTTERQILNELNF